MLNGKIGMKNNVNQRCVRATTWEQARWHWGHSVNTVPSRLRFPLNPNRIMSSSEIGVRLTA